MKKLQVLFFSVSALIFALFISVAEANTKIAPSEAEPGHPITIIDTPEGRLIDGSVAVFKLNGLEIVLPGRTHKPYNTMQSRLAPDMFTGEYTVFARQPDGTEFEIGLFTVLGSTAPPPSISPNIGAPGDTFTITDSSARIQNGDLVVFYAEGSDPTQGVVADNIIIENNTTLTGEVPWDATRGVQNFVSVRPTLTYPSRFGDLAFFVTAPTQFSIGGTVNGLAGTDLVLQNNGADDLSITADGAFTFAAKITDGYDYNVTILAQPTGQICTVSNSSGTVTGADVTNVSVECVQQGYTNASLNGDYSFMWTKISNPTTTMYCIQAGIMNFDGTGTTLVNGTYRCSDGTTETTSAFSKTLYYDVISDGSFTLSSQIAELKSPIHGQITLGGSSLLLDGTLKVKASGPHLWKGIAMKRVATGLPSTYTNASLNGDFLFIKTEINEIPAKFSEQAGTVSFDGVGTALAYGTERVSDGITVTTNTFSITVDYDVASDGSFTLTNQSASQYILHGQILLDGSSLLMDGTLMVGGSYLWKSVAMKRVASGVPPTYTNASLNGDYLFNFTAAATYNPGTTTYCDQVGTVSFDGAGIALADGTERCSDGTTVTITPFSKTLDYDVIADGSFTLNEPGAPAGQSVHGQIVLDSSSLLLDGTLKGENSSDSLTQGVAMKR